MRRVQHHPPYGLGVCLLVGAEYGPRSAVAYLRVSRTMSAAWTRRRMASPTELEELAPHVVYELRAMLAARHLNQVAFAGTFSLEAFLIHVRCLYEFFSRDQPDQRYPKNRYACHYFDPVTEWAATHRPAQPAVFTTDLKTGYTADSLTSARTA